jgi:alcohol dehydrogenase class IV
MAANLGALRSRAPESPALDRYAEVARLLTGDSQCNADDGVMWVKRLTETLRIPSLSAWGIAESDIPSVIERTARASSTKANPIALNNSELASVANSALRNG